MSLTYYVILWTDFNVSIYNTWINMLKPNFEDPLTKWNIKNKAMFENRHAAYF